MGKVDGRSEKTLNLYDYVLENFLEYCGEDILIADVKAKKVREYLADLMDKVLFEEDHYIPNFFSFFPAFLDSGQSVGTDTLYLGKFIGVLVYYVQRVLSELIRNPFGNYRAYSVYEVGDQVLLNASFGYR